MVNQVSIVLPQHLREKAGVLGINISKTCRDAVAAEVERVEKQTGGKDV